MQKCRPIPRGERRRSEIAHIAERVFLERGYNETTMEIVAARAGASKETLYRHFGSKNGLFSEVMRARAARISGADSNCPLDGSPKEVLRRLGLNLLRLLRDADSLRLFRTVIAESLRNPELGLIYFEQGPAQVLAQVATYLDRATQKNLLRCEEPKLAAKLFLGTVIANRHMLMLIAPDLEIVTEETIQKHVEEAVALFLSRYAPHT
jgi:TetR/AcrR family transcriptional regulator, mexJK operon transcriptional repressor